MDRALGLARSNLAQSNPVLNDPAGSDQAGSDPVAGIWGKGGGAEVPVGALVVGPDGTIVGEGANAPVRRHDPTAHAEILVLRQAGHRLGNYRLGGCVLVVTLEPCLMCVGAMVHARLAGVIFGAEDRLSGAVVSGLHGLDLSIHNHRVWHMGGVRATECADLLQTFFRIRRCGAGRGEG